MAYCNLRKQVQVGSKIPRGKCSHSEDRIIVRYKDLTYIYILYLSLPPDLNIVQKRVGMQPYKGPRI